MSCGNTEYTERYLDGQNGDDTQNGKTPETAWKTLTYALQELRESNKNYGGMYRLKINPDNETNPQYKITYTELSNLKDIILDGTDNTANIQITDDTNNNDKNILNSDIEFYNITINCLAAFTNSNLQFSNCYSISMRGCEVKGTILLNRSILNINNTNTLTTTLYSGLKGDQTADNCIIMSNGAIVNVGATINAYSTNNCITNQNNLGTLITNLKLPQNPEGHEPTTNNTNIGYYSSTTTDTVTRMLNTTQLTPTTPTSGTKYIPVTTGNSTGGGTLNWVPFQLNIYKRRTIQLFNRGRLTGYCVMICYEMAGEYYVTATSSWISVTDGMKDTQLNTTESMGDWAPSTSVYQGPIAWKLYNDWDNGIDPVAVEYGSDGRINYRTQGCQSCSMNVNQTWIQHVAAVWKLNKKPS
ncbi:MAG: hypothetical protein LBC39_02565 [Methanobrevibacter sp.]|jgi:hypothetical protein|nr:hypothetical protein [Candidatus Methanovirga aequatorialis]